MLTATNRTLLANRNALTLSTRALVLAGFNMVHTARITRKSYPHQDMHDAWAGMDTRKPDARKPWIGIPSIPGSCCARAGWPVGQPSSKWSLPQLQPLAQTQVVERPVKVFSPPVFGKRVRVFQGLAERCS